DLSALREHLERRRADAGRVADDRQVPPTGALDRADERRRPALDDPEAADEDGRAVLQARDRLVAVCEQLVAAARAGFRIHRAVAVSRGARRSLQPEGAARR